MSSRVSKAWHAQLAGAVDGLLILPASHAVLRATDSEEAAAAAAAAAVAAVAVSAGSAPAEKGLVKI